ncbi:MAG TPA: GAF domain-containing protein [Candidatus Angelobacter sp.]
MTQRYRPAHDLLTSLKALLVFKPSADAGNVLEEVVEQLYQGRGYFWIGIYLAAGDKVIRQCFRGPIPPCHSFALGAGNVGTAGKTGVTKVIPDVSLDPAYSMCFLETKSEIVLPLKIGSRILGVIDVESDRANAFSSQERALLGQAAKVLARYLTTAQGKQLSRMAREKSNAARAETQPHKPPQPARPKLTRAAAGEHSTR